MVLPSIPPLPPDVWAKFIEALRRGPTPEQVRAVERAKEIASTIKLLPYGTPIKNMRRLDPDEVARRMDEKFAAEAARRKAAGEVARRGP